MTEFKGVVELARAEVAGQLIKDMRLACGWTQLQLAEAIGYSRTSITNMEMGRQVITFDVLCLVSDVLGYSLQMRAKRIRP